MLLFSVLDAKIVQLFLFVKLIIFIDASLKTILYTTILLSADAESEQQK